MKHIICELNTKPGKEKIDIYHDTDLEGGNGKVAVTVISDKPTVVLFPTYLDRVVTPKRYITTRKEFGREGIDGKTSTISIVADVKDLKDLIISTVGVGIRLVIAGDEIVRAEVRNNLHGKVMKVLLEGESVFNKLEKLTSMDGQYAYYGYKIGDRTLVVESYDPTISRPTDKFMIVDKAPFFKLRPLYNDEPIEKVMDIEIHPHTSLQLVRKIIGKIFYGDTFDKIINLNMVENIKLK